MNWGLIVGGATLLLVPWVLGRLHQHFTATSIINLNRVAVTAGYGLLVGGLVATSAPRLLREMGLTQFAAICERVLGHLAPSHPAVALVAGGVGLYFVWSAVRAFVDVKQRLAGVRVEPELGRHFRLRGITLVLVPGERPLAYAVPGRRSQVVLAAEWWRGLPPRDRRVVLEHEIGHIALRHRFDLTLITVMNRALGRVPVIREGLDHWHQAVEQSADDAAARRWGRVSVAQTLRRVAVADAGPALAFDGAGTVVNRLEYLSRREPSRRATCAAAGVVGGVVGSALTSAVPWMVHAHNAVVGLIICPL